jgi:hypothetical protein
VRKASEALTAQELSAHVLDAVERKRGENPEKLKVPGCSEVPTCHIVRATFPEKWTFHSAFVILNNGIITYPPSQYSIDFAVKKKKWKPERFSFLYHVKKVELQPTPLSKKILVVWKTFL